MEISFNDKALSGYNVSVSKTFGEREEALRYLLNDKPFKLEKVGNVYIIVPTGENPGSKETPKPLFNPAVFSKEMQITAGKSNAIPVRITEIQLKEIVITEEDVKQKANRTSYHITSLLREGVANAQELLNKIPGIRFDKMSNRLEVNNSADVLLLVDGLQQSPDYIQNLSPYRIQSIEVIHESSGRFLSETYAAIINIILKKDYTGYDIFVSNFSSINASATNGNDWLASEQPLIGMTYTTHAINLYGTYSHNRDRWNMPSSKDLTYERAELISDNPSSESLNHLYEHRNNYLSGGINYQPAKKQIIGLQGDYSSGNTYSNEVYTMSRTDFSSSQNRILKNDTKNRTSDHALTGTLFYQGQINRRFWLHGDFSYNYYYNEIENEYNQNDGQSYNNGNEYNEYKHHTLFNVEGEYLLSSQMAINFGYANIWRKYGSESSHGRGFLDYHESRNKGFAYLSFNPSSKVSTKFGVALEQINTRSRDSKEQYWRVLPYGQVNYKLNHALNINAAYATNQQYPALYQLSPMSAVMDTFLTQIGNPNLKSAITHSASLRISFFDRLTVVPQFHYTHDGISEEYTKKEYKLYRTFTNIDTREYNLHLIYDQPVGLYFRLKNTITYYHDEALHEGLNNSLHGWIVNSEVDYYHPGKSFGIQMGYYRNMKKQILWQGYQMVDKDYWLVTVNKEFWNKRLAVTLSYLPPIDWGVRYDQLKKMDTPLYKEKTALSLKSYNQMVLLKINLRFDHGNIKPFSKPSPVKKEEREKQTIEF
jgi:hypothetical protein